MIGVKIGIQFLCIMFVYCDRVRQLERKLFAMQTMTFQDIGMLRESVDRNFEELQKLTIIINESLSQKLQTPSSVQTTPPDTREKKQKLDGTHLESEVRRLKRGFKDQKLFFHSWKEDLGNKIDLLHRKIDNQSTEIVEKINESNKEVNTVMSLTQETVVTVSKLKETMDKVSNNIISVRDLISLNTAKLDGVYEVNRNSSENITTGLGIIRNELKNSTSGKDVLNTCSATLRKSEKIISLLSLSGGSKDVRLVGGTISSGRLEVFLHGEWGTVCDDDFGVNEALVACKSLGFRGFNYYRPSAYYGKGSGPILFDNVKCSGNEKSLFYCEIDYDTSDCGHGEDVGIECEDSDSDSLSY